MRAALERRLGSKPHTARRLRLRTHAATRATLTLLTHRNIGILTAHQEPLRLRSVQPIMHRLIAATLLLLLTALNVRLIGPLGAISRNLP